MRAYRICFAILIIFAAIHILPTDVFADTGDMYDKHKEKVDNAPLSDQSRDMIKNYDPDTNSIDCDRLDMVCKATAPFITGFTGLIHGLYASVGNFVVAPETIIDNDLFRAYKEGLGDLSLWMMAIFLIFHITKIVSLRFADWGDGNMAMNEKVVLVVVGTILLGIYEYLVTLILTLTNLAIKGVLEEGVTTSEVVLTVFLYGGQYGIMIMAIIALAIFAFSLIFIYRVVLFGLLYSTGVLAIPTMLNDDFNYFNLWLRTFINNSVTFFLQIMAFTIGMRALMADAAFGALKGLPFALAAFLLGLAIPSILGQLGAGTGTGRAIGSAVKVAARKGR